MHHIIKTSKMFRHGYSDTFKDGGEGGDSRNFLVKGALTTCLVDFYFLNNQKIKKY